MELWSYIQGRRESVRWSDACVYETMTPIVLFSVMREIKRWMACMTLLTRNAFQSLYIHRPSEQCSPVNRRALRYLSDSPARAGFHCGGGLYCARSRTDFATISVDCSHAASLSAQSWVPMTRTSLNGVLLHIYHTLCRRPLEVNTSADAKPS
jgi:hypothetical protein